MKEELKSKWLAALRSGKYEQGIRFLKVGNTFCCLGVLCEVDTDVIASDNHYNYKKEMHSTLNEEYISSRGILRSQTMDLMFMNDEDQMSFEHIADWIETNVEVTV